MAPAAGGRDPGRAPRRHDDGRLVRVHGRPRRATGVRRQHCGRTPAADLRAGARTPTSHSTRCFTGTPSDATLASIADAVADGTATFKFFTTDLTTTQSGIRLDNGSARALLEECARLGAMAMVHAEDDDLIKYMEARLPPRGTDAARQCAPRAHEPRRGVRGTDGRAPRPGRGRGRLRRARLRRGGTGHDRGAAGGRTAGLRRGAPQLPVLRARRLRKARRREVPHRDGSTAARGSARRSGAGSPTAACRRSRPTSTRPRYAVKMAGTDIESTPGGHVGIETRGLIGFSEGVGKRGFSLRRFVEVFATNPARVTGLYPRKGVIAPGQRRRPRPLGSGRRAHDHARRPAPRRRLQPVGGLGGDAAGLRRRSSAAGSSSRTADSTPSQAWGSSSHASSSPRCWLARSSEPVA